MRLASFACTLLAYASIATLASRVHATPLPLRLGDASSRLFASKPFESIAGSERVITLAHDVTLAPNTGDVEGSCHVMLQAGAEALSTFSLTLDSGLQVVDASAYESAVAVEQRVEGNARFISVTLAPAIPAGTILEVNLSYAGRLECLPDLTDVAACRFGGDTGFFREGSAFAKVPIAVDSERLLVLRRPSGLAAVSNGELLLERDDGTEAVSHWFDPGTLADTEQLVVLGDLASMATLGTLPETTVRYEPSEAATRAATTLAESTVLLLPLLADQTGRALPFPSLAVVEVPHDPSLSNAALHGMVVLSDAYAAAGASRLRTALAHEVSHLWWGGLVAPTDAARSALLTEGLATLTELDFAAAGRPSAERQAYLARRFREHELVLRHTQNLGALPGALLRDGEAVPDAEPARTIWAYILTSAALEQLRVGVGEAAFAAALRRYVDVCGGRVCATEELFRLVEEQTGSSLDAFVDGFVRARPSGSLVVSFEQLDDRSIAVDLAGVEIEALPLELWVEYDDGRVLAQRVVASEPRIELTVSGPVRRVRPNPRQDALLSSRSSVAGDVDFDGEVDGVDVLHCAWRKGRSAGPGQSAGEGFFGFDLDFDPRCDGDADGRIEQRDLDAIISRVGTLRKEAPR
jgi:hypothetical protein